jgi:hypothetical protein
MSGHSPVLERWVEQARAVPIEDELARRGIKLNEGGTGWPVSKMWW